MWRSKKLITVAVLAAVVLAGSIGGVVLAADNGDDSQPEAKCGALLDRVCEIYEEATGVTIDQEALKDAFTQARSELHPEGMPKCGDVTPEDMSSRLDTLLAEGNITQEQYDKMKARIESMPDEMPGFGFRGHGGFRGMGGMRGFGGPCASAE